MVRGVLGVIFGIVAMVWPVETIVVLTVLWGIWALVEGITLLVQAFRPGTQGRIWSIVMGIIALVAAFFGIFRPGVTAVALTWILGIWLITRGVFELVGAFASSRATPRWLLALSGLLSLVIGVLFVANPGTGAIAVAFWLGIVALIWGIMFVVAAIMVRKDVKTLQAGVSPPPAVA